MKNKYVFSTLAICSLLSLTAQARIYEAKDQEKAIKASEKSGKPIAYLFK